MALLYSNTLLYIPIINSVSFVRYNVTGVNDTSFSTASAYIVPYRCAEFYQYY